MSTLASVANKAGVEYSFKTPGVARKVVSALQRSAERDGFVPLPLDRKQALLDPKSRKIASARMGIPLWSRRDAINSVIAELVEPENYSSNVTRGAIQMSDQIVQAAEILEQSEKLFETQHTKFMAASDAVLKSAKQRVSQLTDYNNRLGAALANLNKALGDERMVAALGNAEKLVQALALLDKLESTGKLDKIMAALQAGADR